MFQESRDMWKKFDQDFRDMACMSNNIMVDSAVQQRKSTETKSSGSRMMTRRWKHKEKAEDGSKMVSRQFIRKYTLPTGAKSEDVVSNLSSDGVLVVTANKSNPAIDVKINQK